MKIRLFFLLLTLNWLIAACQQNEPTTAEILPTPNETASQEQTILGIFPYLSPARLEEVWVPIIVAFSKSSNYNLQFRTTNSFYEFNERLRSNSYDFALVQPFDYIQLAPDTYTPLVMFDEPLTGIFVVRQDSGLQDLSGLAGKTVSTPPETAAVTILAKITLDNLGIENVTYSPQTSHDQCLHTLLIAVADACITNIVPLRTFEEAQGQKLVILGNTLEIPHVLIVANAQAPDEQKEAVKDFFLDLNEYSEGQQLLTNAGIGGFVEATDSDYDVVRHYWAEYNPQVSK